MATPAPGRVEIPIKISTLRYFVNGKWVMAADVAADTLLQDVTEDMPGSTQKAISFPLEIGSKVQHERIIAKEGGITVTYTDPVEVVKTPDVSPNLPRNEFSGKYDSYKIYLVP